jgi:hypothetical protein
LRLWLLALLASCTKPPAVATLPEAARPPAALAVQLPAGWEATTYEAGLGVGPAGRVVVVLEASADKAVNVASLESAVRSGGAQFVTRVKGTDTFFGVTHESADGGVAAVAVVLLQRGAVRCASVGFSSPVEVETALALCRTVEVRNNH